MRYFKFGLMIAAIVSSCVTTSAFAGVIHDLPVSNVALIPSSTSAGQVDGLLANTSGAKLQSVVIEFALLDSDGTQVGNAQTAAMGMAAGANWKFAAPYVGATGAVASVKLIDIMAVPAQ